MAWLSWLFPFAPPDLPFVVLCTALCPWKLTSVALSVKFPCPLAPVEVGQWEDRAGRQGKETEVGRVYLGSLAHGLTELLYESLLRVSPGLANMLSLSLQEQQCS